MLCGGAELTGLVCRVGGFVVAQRSRDGGWESEIQVAELEDQIKLPSARKQFEKVGIEFLVAIYMLGAKILPLLLYCNVPLPLLFPRRCRPDARPVPCD